MTKQSDAVRRRPSEAEVRAISSAQQKHRTMPVRPEIEAGLSETGGLRVGAAHADDEGGGYQLHAALGSRSHQFVQQSVAGLASVVGADGDRLGSAIALIAAVNPQNELEGALAQQMAATHDLAMKMAARAAGATQIDHLNAYSNLATKFERTFAAQIDALTKLRTGGKQVVEHRHVYVANGGQAIVAGEFHHYAAAGKACFAGQPHACFASLPGSDPNGQPVPIAGGEGQKAVSHARRSGRKRRTEGE